jgi:hypothetical protein
MPYKDKEKKKAQRKARQKAYYEVTKERQKVWQKRYYAANKEKVAARNKAWNKANQRILWCCHIKRMFNLTPEQYDAMLIEQSGRCAMCDEPLLNGNNGSHIDHCHATGRVRGILHGNCNMKYVGTIECDPVKFDKALGYLARVNAPCQEVAA